jgi:hypothetical protein
LLGIERDRETLPANQLGVADLSAATGDYTLGNTEFARAEPFCRFHQQRLTCSRGRLTQLHACDLDGETGPGLALVGREEGIALD